MSGVCTIPATIIPMSARIHRLVLRAYYYYIKPQIFSPTQQTDDQCAVVNRKHGTKPNHSSPGRL